MIAFDSKKIPELPEESGWLPNATLQRPAGRPADSVHGAPSCRMLLPTKTRAFTAQTYHEPAYRFLWHYHPEWEIMFCRSGRGTRHVGNSVEKFGPGDLTMLPGKIPHTWFSGENQVGSSCCTVIHFLPAVWGVAFWRLPELASFHALCHGALRGVQFIGAGVEEVGQRMEALAAKGQDTASLASLLELGEIFDLLTKLEVRSLNGSAEGAGGGQSRQLEDLLAWLDEKAGDPINQQDAAARVRMSPSAFCRWFKMNMGCRFNRYLNEIRVAKVCSGIASRGMSVTEAAYDAGYNNLSNFNRRFREVTGITPSAFRAQWLQGR